MNLVLFDFDGTVTDCDSFLLFVRHAVGERKFFYGAAVLSPKILRFKMGKYPNYRLKQDFLAYFFGGWKEDDFNHAAHRFSCEKIPAIVRSAAMHCIRTHHEQGDQLVLVSASPENTLTLWCRQTGLDLLATRLEIVDGQITGRLLGKNCWGDEKVARVKKAYNINEFDQIYAYGDSAGDRAMLALADKPFYRQFT
jgi:HAD superfamily hydrolase (TIGR01490 family)